MRKAILVLVPGLFLLFGACNKDSGRMTDAELGSQSPPEAVDGTGKRAAKSSAPARMWDTQKLVRTAHLDVEVDRVEDAFRTVQRIARTHDGLIADSETARDDQGHESATVQVHVPSERLDDALSAIRKLGTVRGDRIHAQDVTKEYFDLETRLRVKRETEGRLRELLRTGTGHVSQVLEVERELERVVGQIEEMEGAKRYYDQQISVSTITLRLSEPGALLRTGGLSKIRHAMGDALDVLALSVAALVYIVCFVVPWIVVVALLWWLVKALRRRQARAQGHS